MDSRTGEPITALQAQSGAYIWLCPEPLHFRLTKHLGRTSLEGLDIIHLQIRFNHNLRKALDLHRCFFDFRIWTTILPPEPKNFDFS